MQKSIRIALGLAIGLGVSAYSHAAASSTGQQHSNKGGNTQAASEPAAEEVTPAAEAEYGVYTQLGVRVFTAQQIAQVKSVKAAVKKADVPPESDEAAMIRISMGVEAELAHQPNDCCFDADGDALADRDVAERLAVEEAMRRMGIEPGSEQEAQLRAAAEGRAETADGEEVDQQTMEDMAKEVAKQQAALYSGAQSGSQGEAMINLGVDVLWDKMKNWGK